MLVNKYPVNVRPVDGGAPVKVLWAPVVDNQGSGWSTINNSQTSTWGTINDNQTPAWTPVFTG